MFVASSILIGIEACMMNCEQKEGYKSAGRKEKDNREWIETSLAVAERKRKRFESHLESDRISALAPNYRDSFSNSNSVQNTTSAIAASVSSEADISLPISALNEAIMKDVVKRLLPYHLLALPTLEDVQFAAAKASDPQPVMDEVARFSLLSARAASLISIFNEREQQRRDTLVPAELVVLENRLGLEEEKFLYNKLRSDYFASGASKILNISQFTGKYGSTLPQIVPVLQDKGTVYEKGEKKEKKRDRYSMTAFTDLTALSKTTKKLKAEKAGHEIVPKIKHRRSVSIVDENKYLSDNRSIDSSSTVATTVTESSTIGRRKENSSSIIKIKPPKIAATVKLKSLLPSIHLKFPTEQPPTPTPEEDIPPIHIPKVRLSLPLPLAHSTPSDSSALSPATPKSINSISPSKAFTKTAISQSISLPKLKLKMYTKEEKGS